MSLQLKNIKNFYLKAGNAINKASANQFEFTLTSFKNCVLSWKT